MSAGNLDSAFDEQTLTAERSAGHEPAFIAERELRDIERMETINVLCRIERAHDGRFIDLFWWRRLNKNSVNGGIAIQLCPPARAVPSASSSAGNSSFTECKPEIPAHFVL